MGGNFSPSSGLSKSLLMEIASPTFRIRWAETARRSCTPTQLGNPKTRRGAGVGGEDVRVGWDGVKVDRTQALGPGSSSRAPDSTSLLANKPSLNPAERTPGDALRMEPRPKASLGANPLARAGLTPEETHTASGGAAARFERRLRADPRRPGSTLLQPRQGTSSNCAEGGRPPAERSRSLAGEPGADRSEGRGGEGRDRTYRARRVGCKTAPLASPPPPGPGLRRAARCEAQERALPPRRGCEPGAVGRASAELANSPPPPAPRGGPAAAVAATHAPGSAPWRLSALKAGSCARGWGCCGEGRPRSAPRVFPRQARR